ncbi:MAG: hypothetical protein PHQ40_08090 [Anaerolineaceae bacterium]|nr:hypothetical protein [Anaerolineaceae bacterium]
MTKSIENLLELIQIVCPDDGTMLEISNNNLVCSRCYRRYPIIDDKVIDLLPSKPNSLNGIVSDRYRDDYLEEFSRILDISKVENAWGAPEMVPAGWMKKRLREVKFLKPRLVNDDRTSVLCDFSAGAGYYTFSNANQYQFVLHCDLSVSSICYAYQRAKSLGLNNIFFLRIDYLCPPFRGSLPRIICLDTLIRGEEHERQLLRSIRNSLAPQGIAYGDFHNWWHNPLRRIGLLAQNFGENTSYTKRQLKNVLHEVGIENYRTYNYCQEVDQTNSMGRLVSTVLPPTRFVISFSDENSTNS